MTTSAIYNKCLYYELAKHIHVHRRTGQTSCRGVSNALTCTKKCKESLCAKKETERGEKESNDVCSRGILGQLGAPIDIDGAADHSNFIISFLSLSEICPCLSFFPLSGMIVRNKKGIAHGAREPLKKIRQ